MIDSQADSTILYDVHTYSYPNWVTDIDKDENIYVEYQNSHQTGSKIHKIKNIKVLGRIFLKIFCIESVLG